MIIISPFSRPLRGGGENPKNYPHWPAVVRELVNKYGDVLQVGANGEPGLTGVSNVALGCSLRSLLFMINQCKAWISVDNFFPHLASHTTKRGVVLFSRSDPLIFGYPQNVNLLKSRHLLRLDQFRLWDQCKPVNEDPWVNPSAVVYAVDSLVAARI